MEVALYNTAVRDIEVFRPLTPGKVGLYCCGPTVYNFAHIGNLRTYVFEDLLRRVLEDAGFVVEHVVNVTDVGHLTSDGDEGEDKMIRSAREKGMSVWDIARFFTEAFFDDWEALRLRPPRRICKATEHIDEMIAFIRRLEENGFAYLSGGNVYFDTSLLADYGRMALLDRQTSDAVSRIEIDKGKKNTRDFVLWFTQGKFGDQAMVWDSPWGRGYPGWHIECSAMSSRYLGERFDIHCGGVDHIAVHHTNEIAQSEAAFGHPWVNYWLHGEFLLLQKEKMSKSSGDFLTLGALSDRGYGPMDYRFFLLNAHYRTQLVFSEEALEAARSGRRNLVERLATLAQGLDRGQEIFQVAEVVSPAACKVQLKMREALYHDLNAPVALAHLWSAIKDQSFSVVEKLELLGWADTLLALGLEEAFVQDTVPPEIKELARCRIEARRAKDWPLADTLRRELDGLGWIIEDGPEHFRLKKKV